MALSMSVTAAYYLICFCISVVASRANLPEGFFDVTKHGAVAGGKTESSSAFVAAWDAACSYCGNSTFYIPEGTFLLGPTTFKGPCHNNQTPNVEIKGSLVALPNLSDFVDFDWIVFKDMRGLKLTGSGSEVARIDGQGGVEAWKKKNCGQSKECKKKITSLKFKNVSHGTISNITVSNGKGFHVKFNDCDNMGIHHVDITAPGDSPNTDGIHVSKSTNISIATSKIGVGDDCVSIGPGSINVSIFDVNCGPGHGLSVGSLGRDKSEGDVVGINIRNCTISGTQNGVRVKTLPGSPASKAYDLTFEDIVTINVSNPIIINQEYCASDDCHTSASAEPSRVKLSNIYFKNIRGTYNTEAAVNLICSSLVPCESIHLIDINLYSIGKETPVQGGCNKKGTIDGLEILCSTISCN